MVVRLVLGQIAGIELVIAALLGNEVVVRAALDDAALFQDHDAVCVADSGEAVGDDEAGAAVHQAVHAALHQSLGAGVDNLLQREFEAYGPRIVLLTDITYLPYNGTFAYLSTYCVAARQMLLSICFMNAMRDS